VSEAQLDQVLLTSALTVIGGVFVFVVGQIILRFVIDPVLALRQVIAEIADAMIYNAPVIVTPIARSPENVRELRDTLRAKSSLLQTRMMATPWADFFAARGLIPQRASIETAVRSLRGLSHVVTSREQDAEKMRIEAEAIERYLRAIEQALGFPKLI
jgi:hypothetical protein